MKPSVKTILKDVIQENAVEFKNNTTKILYEKVGNSLQKKYKDLSKDFFDLKNNKK